MRLKRAYLNYALQMGQYTMRSLDGGEDSSGAWSLHLHPELSAISVRLGPDELYVPLVHVESFELLAVEDDEFHKSTPEETREAILEAAERLQAPVKRGPGRPRTKRIPAEL